MNNLDLTNAANLIQAVVFPQFGIFIKVGFLALDLFLIFFLLVVIKQVHSMNHIVHDSNDFLFIKTFAFLLLFIAASLFLISLAIL